MLISKCILQNLWWLLGGRWIHDVSWSIFGTVIAPLANWKNVIIVFLLLRHFVEFSIGLDREKLKQKRSRLDSDISLWQMPTVM